MRGPDPPALAAVVPTLDEARRLPGLLADLGHLRIPWELVVCDGGSTDGTVDLARQSGARVLTAPPGRASQLMAGARATAAPWLLFLHADSRVPTDAVGALEDFLASAGEDEVAYFQFALEGNGRFWRFLERGQRLRERALGLVYGDQGLVVSRAAFDAVGGYPSWPIMEDVGILERLRKVSRIRRLPACMVTSPRRYEAEGRWFGWLRNASLIALYRLGVPPARLARWYPRDGRPERDRQSPSGDRPASDTEPRLDGRVPPLPEDRGGVEERRALIVFAKAPRPGRVKTRLAADLGAQEAARVYRRLGRRVLDAVREGPYRTLVYYDPPDAEAEMRDWLGGESLEFRPQTEGDLGERMVRAFEEALRDADRACIMGTDVPALRAALVVQALERLESADVVLGPAEDGGYYLMALSRPHPEIFRDVPWSTADVLGATLERTRRAGLRESLLPVLKDVDTAADLPAYLL